jgi:hypothetical protein
LSAGGGVTSWTPEGVLPGFAGAAGSCATTSTESSMAVIKIITIECRRNLIMFSPSSLRRALPLTRAFRIR